jgi:uncharacterized protein (TIGR00730 family)
LKQIDAMLLENYLLREPKNVHLSFKIICIVKKICVFCGSSMGVKSAYKEAAVALGIALAERQDELIYGGANVGLMKVLAETMMQKGGRVVGIMPHHLIRKEVAHNGIDLMHEVQSMAERKELMVELSDAFIAMPGGFGTLDEISEILTLNQLRIADKPIALLNIEGYFDHLLAFLDHGVKEGFIRPEHRENIIVSDDPFKLPALLEAYRPVEIGKWIEDIKQESSL